MQISEFWILHDFHPKTKSDEPRQIQAFLVAYKSKKRSGEVQSQEVDLLKQGNDKPKLLTFIITPHDPQKQKYTQKNQSENLYRSENNLHDRKYILKIRRRTNFSSRSKFTRYC